MNENEVLAMTRLLAVQLIEDIDNYQASIKAYDDTTYDEDQGYQRYRAMSMVKSHRAQLKNDGKHLRRQTVRLEKKLYGIE